jgi:hypothetical protein
MNNNNVAAVRNAYAVAERKDPEGWINLFTPDGVFVDNSVGATYRGRALADPVRNYGTAFSNMHRELYRVMCSNSNRLLPRGVDHFCSTRGLEQPRRGFEALRIVCFPAR